MDPKSLPNLIELSNAFFLVIKLRNKIKASFCFVFSLFVSDSRCSEFGGAQNSAVCVCVSALKGRRISNGEAEEVDLKVRFP